MKRKTSNRAKDTWFTLKWVTSPAALEATRRDPSGVYLADYHLGEYFGLEFLRQKVVTGCLARRHFVL